MERLSLSERCTRTACAEAAGVCCAATSGAIVTHATTSGVSGYGALLTSASQPGIHGSGCTEVVAGYGAAADAEQHALRRAAEQEAGVSNESKALTSQARREAAASSSSDGQRDAAAHLKDVCRGPKQAACASCSGTAAESPLPMRVLSESTSEEGAGTADIAAPANQQQSPAPRRFIGRRAAAAAAAASGGDAAKALAATLGSAKAQRFVRQQVCSLATILPLQVVNYCSASNLTLPVLRS